MSILGKTKWMLTGAIAAVMAVLAPLIIGASASAAQISSVSVTIPEPVGGQSIPSPNNMGIAVGGSGYSVDSGPDRKKWCQGGIDDWASCSVATGTFVGGQTYIAMVILVSNDHFSVNPSVTINGKTATYVNRFSNGLYLAVGLGFVAKSYSYTITPASDYTFPSKTVGYGAADKYSFTLDNTGSGGLSLNVGLTGANAGAFVLSHGNLSGSTVLVRLGGKVNKGTVKVAPKTGLGVGSYTARVTVSGDGVESRGFNVSFVVKAASGEGGSGGGSGGSSGGSSSSTNNNSGGSVTAATTSDDEDDLTNCIGGGDLTNCGDDIDVMSSDIWAEITGEKGGFPWWIVFVVGGVLIVGGIFATILILRKKKKNISL